MKKHDIQAIARRAVFLQVKNGALPRVKTMVCVDCGAQAEAYDHREYSKPLDVEPVCHVCNHKRGPAVDSPKRSAFNGSYKQTDPEVLQEMVRFKAEILEATNALSEARKRRGIEIVTRIDNGDSFTDIARDLGISRERVRQLWFRAKAEGRK
jgi:hypothetical protein